MVFDLEANADSPHPENQEIVEIGALSIQGGNVVGCFHSLVAPTPGRALASLTVKLTGITEDMLRGAPMRTQALSEFLEFCGDAPMVAHNGHGYDYPLLVAELRRVGLEGPVGERLDSLDLARSAFGRGSPRPGRSPPMSRRLDALADFYQVETRGNLAHRALADAWTLWEVTRFLLSDLPIGTSRLGTWKALALSVRGATPEGKARVSCLTLHGGSMSGGSLFRPVEP